MMFGLLFDGSAVEENFAEVSPAHAVGIKTFVGRNDIHIPSRGGRGTDRRFHEF